MQTRRRTLALGLGGAGIAAAPATRAQDGARREHRLIIQVSDRHVAALALSNAVNVSYDLSEIGEEIQIEFVAYGPGLHMLREDTSDVRDRVRSIAASMPNVAFSACGNTITTMEKDEGRQVALLQGIKIMIVRAGVLRILELQEKGWSYLRP